MANAPSVGDAAERVPLRFHLSCIYFTTARLSAMAELFGIRYTTRFMQRMDEHTVQVP